MTQTIAILRRLPGEKIPRPYTRACSQSEAQDMLGRPVQIDWSKLNSDEAVAEIYGAEFFAFTEQ